MREWLLKMKNPVTMGLFLVAIPTVVAVGALLFREKQYAWISLCVAVIASLPLFYSFERKESSSKELVVLAALVALSAAGRFVFAWLPAIKPITALTVIAAVWLGKEAGFVVGALSAVVSNFYFGQGPWTPFQMFAWGFLGLLAGLLSTPLKKSRLWLCVYGALAGVLFSVVLDVWTTLWAGGTFTVSRYLAILLSSMPTTVQYALSNVLFLILLAKPIGEKLERVTRKYGLFIQNKS